MDRRSGLMRGPRCSLKRTSNVFLSYFAPSKTQKYHNCPKLTFSDCVVDFDPVINYRELSRLQLLRVVVDLVNLVCSQIKPYRGGKCQDHSFNAAKWSLSHFPVPRHFCYNVVIPNSVNIQGKHIQCYVLPLKTTARNFDCTKTESMFGLIFRVSDFKKPSLQKTNAFSRAWASRKVKCYGNMHLYALR
jgi:hypothetical protein